MGPGHGLTLNITIPNWCGKWVVPMSDFKDGVVGAKSKNLANLRGKLPDWIRLPPAVTVPFSSFEQVGLGGRAFEGGEVCLWVHRRVWGGWRQCRSCVSISRHTTVQRQH